jgi:hypothetical protein
MFHNSNCDEIQPGGVIGRTDILHAWDSYKLKLKNLTPEQVQKIDEYLASVRSMARSGSLSKRADCGILTSL